MAEDEQAAYRQFLPDLDSPRFTTMQQQDAKEYAAAFQRDKQPPWLHALWQHWRTLFAEPFRGITSDGVVRPGLFTLQDEGVPVGKIASAAEALLGLLDAPQRERVSHHIDSPEWRSWSNPEFLLSDKGIRLDEVSDAVREAALEVLRCTLSPEGYAKALGAMRINGFLGRLVGAPRICNEFSYNMALFGAPSDRRPWGFSFYGHHLCLNVLLFRNQMVLSPWFTGAEPNVIDDPADPHAGTRILHEEERLGLELMQSLPGPLQARAQTPPCPPGRWNHDDQRHLCGAYRDNRVVPYEGVRVSDMGAPQQALVSAVLEQYLLYLPAASRARRLAQARAHFDETYFCWIGGFGDGDDAFYYRVQSPVVIAEFDHHSGVFLTNKEPARFHIHTLLRTPNGGDYGMALRPLMGERSRTSCGMGSSHRR
ncbi:hypothetical protein PG995_014266 [Apiospora arundinis]